MDTTADGARIEAIDTTQVTPLSFDLMTLQDGESCRIGRADDNNIIVKNDAKCVSRYHALIQRKRDQFVLVDLQDKGGTFVSGSKVTDPWYLLNEDRIGLASISPLLRFVDCRHIGRKRLIYLNPDLLQYEIDGAALELPPEAFRFFRLLHQANERVCRYEEIIEHVWMEDKDVDIKRRMTSLQSLVYRVRDSLKEAKVTSLVDVTTHRNIGYSLQILADEE
jgi:hypothetical protein